MSAASLAQAIKTALREAGCGSSVHEDAIGSVDGLLAPFAGMPDASEFDDTIADLELALAKLSSGEVSEDVITKLPVSVNMELLKMGAVTGELTEWKGDAMESFRDNVQTMFPGVVKNLYNATAVLHGAVTAEQALWTAARADVEKICQQIISSADKFCETGGNGSASFFITVVGSVVGVVLAVPTGGASVAAVAGVFAVAGAGASMSWDVGTIEQAVDQLRESLQVVKDTITEKEEMIRTALEGIEGALSAGGSGYALDVGEVDLMNGPGGLDDRV